MDTRYRDRGYKATFTEMEGGGFLDVHRNGRQVAQVCIMSEDEYDGDDTPMQVVVVRQDREEFRDILIQDDAD